jgi:hypothetical protein
LELAGGAGLAAGAEESVSDGFFDHGQCIPPLFFGFGAA